MTFQMISATKAEFGKISQGILQKGCKLLIITTQVNQWKEKMCVFLGSMELKIIRAVYS